jgi:DNA adenine methylase
MKTPLRYAGGKTKAINKIVPFLTSYDEIISPFIGGGSLEVYMASQGKKVIGFDVFYALTNFWRVLLNRKDDLVSEMKIINPTNEEYNRIKEILIKWDKTQNLLSNWKTNYYHRDNPIDLDEVVSAAYYFFNHNTSYGPGFLGWPSSVYLNTKKWNSMIKNIELFKVPTLEVQESDFENVILNNKNKFMYLDPPYFLEKDKDNKMFTGIYPMRNIPVHHDNFDHEKLRDLLISHKGDFVLSYNNCETIRNYYSDFEQFFPEWSYSMGNGEKRVGKNRLKMGIGSIKESHEILIVKRG